MRAIVTLLGSGRLLLVAALSAEVVVLGQTLLQTAAPSGRPEFEAASVKPSPNPGGEAYVQVVPGRLRMQNIPARNLIQLGYGVESYQITGGPAWIGSDRFDIEAKADGSPSTQQMQGPMLRGVLEDRFRLVVHRETKEAPVYEMRLLNGSGKMQPSTAVNCVPYRPDAPPPPVPGSDQPRPNFCDYPHLGRQGPNRTLDGKGISIADMAGTLARVELHRPVLDRTGLTGRFDIHLEWTPDSAPGADNPEPSDIPSIFTALREQLGLKLDPGRGPSEIIVVDRIEKPSVN